jgi:ornithine carbamoyltransferase
VKDLLSVNDLSRERLFRLFTLAADLKQRWKAGRRGTPLAGRSLALIFEKQSLRTRVTFEVGIVQLGGRAVYLAGSEIGLGTRETVPDVARNLSRWVDGIAARVYSHATVEGLARHATIPVINGLSDFEHPCQALADLLTIREQLGDPRGRVLTYLGDGNNVAHSLLLAGTKAGMHVRVATPPGFEPIPQVVHRAEEIAAETGGSVELTHDPEGAAVGAHVLSTDVWTSMGQDLEADERALVFPSYQLSQKLIDLADPEVIVLHCLPAHRGQEITDEVIDGPRSVVWDQAENRLHTQKALLLRLFGVA